MTMLAPHFSSAEFRCPCCNRTGPVSSRLLGVLENVRRAKGGRPLRIVSGVRCERFNRRVGGMRTSEHLFGRAVDVPGDYATVDEWKAAGAVGIGVRRGRVVHVDVTPGRAAFVFVD